MKSPEFMSHSEKEIEENIRLMGGDPKGNKKGLPYKKYVSIKNVADSKNYEDEIINNIDNINKEEKIENNLFDEDEITEAEKQNEFKKAEEIGLIKRDGVAHIGPEFSDAAKIEKIKSEIYKSNKDEIAGKSNLEDEEVLVSPKIEKLEKEPFFASRARSLRDLFLSYYNFRKEDQVMDKTRNTGTEHDNLHTMPDKKIERLSRKKLREILHNQEN
jgi:hypothetical protein